MNQKVLKPVYLDGDRLFIIDQRRLPGAYELMELKNKEEVINAIKTLAVRGAPAIGIAGAYGAYVSLRNIAGTSDFKAFSADAGSVLNEIEDSRPTAYNLKYALDRIRKVVLTAKDRDEALLTVKTEAEAIHREDLERSKAIAAAGLSLVPQKAGILSHCNAGGLATGGLGTSLAVVFKAHESGKGVFVYVDETRPLLQGARLTAWELEKRDIPYKVICDNMAAMLMAQGKIDLVLVGADRIARNGDFANKIGTYSIAVLAHYHGVPFYTAAPYSTFDFNIESGLSIPIEERNQQEVLEFAGVKTAPDGASAVNPSFDVTPHKLLTGIITEYGVLYPPFQESIEKLSERLKV